MKFRSTQSGMTLIQMAGILLIISIMMVPFFQIQSLSKKNEIRSESKGQVSDVSQALVQFALTNGRYPLPANPRWGLNVPQSGVEAPITIAGMTDAAPTVRDRCGLVNGADRMVCVNGIATPYSAIDNPSQENNRIVIGTLPYTALGLTPAQSLDEYGDKLTYAVTYGLTKAQTFLNDKGNIQVNDQLQSAVNCPLFMNGGNPSTQAHFVIVSHGQNRVGAFPATGGGRVCNGTILSGDERENCNNDATFRVLSKRVDADCAKASATFTHRMPGVNNLNTFDDMIAFRTTLNIGNWTAQKTVDAGGASIYQTYLGYRNSKENVVIGSSDPSSVVPTLVMKKPGNGQVQVEGANDVQADRIDTQFLCSVSNRDNNLFREDRIADSCFRIRFLTQTNGLLGVGAPVTALVPNSFDTTITSTKLYVDILGGYAAGDRGMLRVDSRSLNQVQSGKIVTKIGVLPGDCTDTGIKGINAVDGSLACY